MIFHPPNGLKQNRCVDAVILRQSQNIVVGCNEVRLGDVNFLTEIDEMKIACQHVVFEVSPESRAELRVF